MPKLKSTLENLDDVADSVREFYEEKDGKFVLQVEGMQADGDVNRLKSAHEATKRELAAAKKSLEPFKDMKPEEVHKAMDELEELRTLKEQGKLGGDDEAQEKLIAARVNREVAPLKREIDRLTKEHTTAAEKLAASETENRKLTLRDTFAPIIAKSGIVASAHDDVMDLVERVFDRTEDGKFLTKPGTKFPEAMSPEQFIGEALKESRPHYWPSSKGGGSGGGDGGGNGAGNNPYSREHWNMGEQGRLEQTDRAKAERLAVQAGTTLGGGMPAAKAK